MTINDLQVGDFLAFYPDPKHSRRTIKTEITGIETLRPGRTRRDLVLTVLEQNSGRDYQVGQQIHRMEGDVQIATWRDRDAVTLPRYLIQDRYIALEVSGCITLPDAPPRTIRWKLTRHQAQQIVPVLNAAVRAGFDHMTSSDRLLYQAAHGTVTSRRVVDDPELVEPAILLQGLRPLYLAGQVAAECQTAFELGACV
ncbi:hypothetical protein GCM10022226_61610 [Sphaerisporangium flaviroseum]|uniref:Uncharacterized protein n=1 Tax=Sphaerisporangium flaviroseum TaxID=509199 RepID=A0ABP7J2D3_9ACTN